jgi:hypothetical protein
MIAKPFDLIERQSADGESAGHIDHIDHASQKYEQKQTVNGPTNVIAPKSRPITSITSPKKRYENNHIENRARYRSCRVSAKIDSFPLEKCKLPHKMDQLSPRLGSKLRTCRQKRNTGP